MIKIMPFHESHLDLWETVSTDRVTLSKAIIKTRDYITTRTAIIDYKVVGFGGIDTLFKNKHGRAVAELWLDIDGKLIMEMDKLRFFYAMKKEFKTMLRSVNACRVQAVVENSDRTAQRFASVMGLQAECSTMHCLSWDGGTSTLFSKVDQNGIS